MFPPESAAITRELTRYAVEHMQLVAVCWVMPASVEGAEIISIQAHKIYGDLLPFAVVETEKEGWAWVRAELAKAAG
jgi:hypothetical protein